VSPSVDGQRALIGSRFSGRQAATSGTLGARRCHSQASAYNDRHCLLLQRLIWGACGSQAMRCDEAILRLHCLGRTRQVTSPLTGIASRQTRETEVWKPHAVVYPTFDVPSKAGMMTTNPCSEFRDPRIAAHPLICPTDRSATAGRFAGEPGGPSGPECTNCEGGVVCQPPFMSAHFKLTRELALPEHPTTRSATSGTSFCRGGRLTAWT
jgi:hypothetical protein